MRPPLAAALEAPASPSDPSKVPPKPPWASAHMYRSRYSGATVVPLPPRCLHPRLSSRPHSWHWEAPCPTPKAGGLVETCQELAFSCMLAVGLSALAFNYEHEAQVSVSETQRPSPHICVLSHRLPTRAAPLPRAPQAWTMAT